MARRRILGIGLLVVGVALLFASVSAGIGILDGHATRAQPVNVAAPAPASPDGTRVTVVFESPLLDVERGLDVPVDLAALDAAPLADAPTVELAGVRADVDVARSQPAARSQGAGGAQLVDASSQALGIPAAQAVAAGAAAFTAAGLLAYFWTSAKAWAFRLLVLPVVPLYAKITRAEVFGNAVRERIFSAIKANPGASASDLARLAGVSWGTTIYHLDVLEHNRMVTSLRNGRHRRYFENGAPLAVTKEVVAILQNRVTASVADTVRAAPGMTQKDLATQLGMSPQALHWHLARLCAAGLVRKVRYGRTVRHFVVG